MAQLRGRNRYTLDMAGRKESWTRGEAGAGCEGRRETEGFKSQISFILWCRGSARTCLPCWCSEGRSQWIHPSLPAVRRAPGPEEMLENEARPRPVWCGFQGLIMAFVGPKPFCLQRPLPPSPQKNFLKVYFTIALV